MGSLALDDRINHLALGQLLRVQRHCDVGIAFGSIILGYAPSAGFGQDRIEMTAFLEVQFLGQGLVFELLVAVLGIVFLRIHIQLDPLPL